MKKGEIEISHLIGGVIAVAILIIVVFGVYGFYTGKAYAFFDFLPGFNSTKEGVKGIEILRYDIFNGKVEYYDGIDWNGFSGKMVKFGDKKINYDDMKNTFENFYYKSDRGKKIIELNLPLNNILIVSGVGEADRNKLVSSYGNPVVDAKIVNFYNPSFSYFEPKSELGFKRSTEDNGNGEVEALLVKDNGNGAGALFFLGIDNSFRIGYFIGDEIKYGRLEVKERSYLADIFNGMKEWRDSVFKKPILISYGIDKGNESASYCIEVKDKIYLVVDLNKKASGGDC